METIKEREDQNWRLAKMKAGFKSHLIIYLVVSMGMWLWWCLTDSGLIDGVPWPFWPSLGWGISLAYQYFSALYRNNINKAL